MNKLAFKGVLPRASAVVAVVLVMASLSLAFFSKTSSAQTSSISNVTPVANSIIPASQTFSWSSVTGANEYWVTLKRGSVTVYDRSTGPNTSVTISNILQNGSQLTLQIWYRIGSTWYTSNTTPAKQVTYTAGGTGGTITSLSPDPNNSTFKLSSSQTFTWSRVLGEREYWVELKRGTRKYYDRTNGLNNSVTIGGIPQDGQNVTLVIWYRVDSSTQWMSQEFTYRTEVSVVGPGIATISPQENTSISSSQTFIWSQAAGALEYWVELKRGTRKYYDRTNGLNNSVTIGGIPQDGQNVTLVIWYRTGSGNNDWESQEFMYRTESTEGRAITTVTPTASSIIPASQTFTWNSVSGASEYWVTLKRGNSTFYDRSTGPNTSVTIVNVPQDGSTLTFQIWYKMNGTWYTSNTVPAKEVSYRAGNLPTGGGSITTVSPTPSLSTIIPASQVFTWNPVSGAAEYWVTLKKGSLKVFDRSAGASPQVTISNIPQDGSTLTLQIWYRIGSTWYTSDTIPAKEATYTSGGTSGGGGGGTITTVTPTASSIIPASQTFTWNSVSGASEYWVTLKSGSAKLYDRSTGSVSSVTISNIPQNASPLILQIWYRIGSTWYTSNITPAKEVTYTAGGTGETPGGATTIMTVSPPASSVLSSANQVFTWNSVTNATEYWVTVKKGSVKLYDQSTSISPQVTISDLPQDGSTLTLQIWYRIGSTWYTSTTIPAKEVTYSLAT